MSSLPTLKKTPKINFKNIHMFFFLTYILLNIKNILQVIKKQALPVRLDVPNLVIEQTFMRALTDALSAANVNISTACFYSNSAINGKS